MKKFKVLLQKATILLSILFTFYLIACYVDIVANNTSKQNAKELQEHNYNIFISEVIKDEQ